MKFSVFLVAAVVALASSAWAMEPEKKAQSGHALVQIKQRRSIEPDDGSGRSVAFSADGKAVATCGDRFVQLFNVQTGERLQRFDGHVGGVAYVAFSPDGKLLASAGEDLTIRLWEADTGKPRGVLKKAIEDDRVPSTCLAFTPDGKTLASCSQASQSVWLWDVENAQWEYKVPSSHPACMHVAFSPDGKHFGTAGKGSQVTHELKRGWGLRPVFRGMHDAGSNALCVSFSPDGKRLLSTGSDNTIRVWEVPQGGELLKLQGPKDANGIQAATFTPDGARIISITRNETIQVWQAEGGALLGSCTGSDQNVRALAMSRDGRLLATCGDSQVIKLWDLDPSDKPEVDSRPDPAPKETGP